VRQKWVRESAEATARVREAGVPLVGYTWWPLFALVTWAYRQGANPAEYYLKQMGLWDLRDTPQGKLQRVPTDLVTEFKQMAAGGAPETRLLRG